MWMLLERVRFTLDGLECDKIGVSYQAFRSQPDFCGAPFESCLHNQLWHYWEVSKYVYYYLQHIYPLYLILLSFR